MLPFPILGQGASTELLRCFCVPVQGMSHQPVKLLVEAVGMTAFETWHRVQCSSKATARAFQAEAVLPSTVKHMLDAVSKTE